MKTLVRKMVATGGALTDFTTKQRILPDFKKIFNVDSDLGFAMPFGALQGAIFVCHIMRFPHTAELSTEEFVDYLVPVLEHYIHLEDKPENDEIKG